jgi:hypothetical protein
MSEYRLRVENKGDWGTSVGFYEIRRGAIDSAPSAHCIIHDEDRKKIEALPPEAGTYTWRDEQKIVWEASIDDSGMVNLVCQSPIIMGDANGFISLEAILPKVKTGRIPMNANKLATNLGFIVAQKCAAGHTEPEEDCDLCNPKGHTEPEEDCDLCNPKGHTEPEEDCDLCNPKSSRGHTEPEKDCELCKTSPKKHTASVLKKDDHPPINVDIQVMVGDPSDIATSTFSQFKPSPGEDQLASPLSPIQGDEIFFTYMIPGAVFQSHDGQQWEIEQYTYQGQVEISNRWYPRLHAQVSIYDIRRSIHSWVEPIQQLVPPIPAGVNYDAQPVRIVDK